MNSSNIHGQGTMASSKCTISAAGNPSNIKGQCINKYQAQRKGRG